MAGGPLTKAPLSWPFNNAVRKASVYGAAPLRSKGVPIFTYKVPAKAFSCVISEPGITCAAFRTAALNPSI